MYKGKFMAGLKDLRSAGKLLIPDGAAGLSQEDGWKRFIDHLYRTDWNVYIKQTFNGNGNAIEYLSRYANRIAISNSRILSFKDGNVTFSYTDRKDGGRKKEKPLLRRNSSTGISSMSFQRGSRKSAIMDSSTTAPAKRTLRSFLSSRVDGSMSRNLTATPQLRKSCPTSAAASPENALAVGKET